MLRFSTVLWILAFSISFVWGGFHFIGSAMQTPDTWRAIVYAVGAGLCFIGAVWTPIVGVTAEGEI